MQLSKIALQTASICLLAFAIGSSSETPTLEANATPVRAPARTQAAPKPANSPASTVAPSVALANHLKGKGAKMYATFWCPVCRWQERQFGAQALNLIKSMQIECDPRGKNPQPALCDRANIRAFPTWEINGKLYEGGMPLEELAEVSGYQGSKNFGPVRN